MICHWNFYQKKNKKVVLAGQSASSSWSAGCREDRWDRRVDHCTPVASHHQRKKFSLHSMVRSLMTHIVDDRQRESRELLEEQMRPLDNFRGKHSSKSVVQDVAEPSLVRGMSSRQVTVLQDHNIRHHQLGLP